MPTRITTIKVYAPDKPNIAGVPTSLNAHVEEMTSKGARLVQLNSTALNYREVSYTLVWEIRDSSKGDVSADDLERMLEGGE